MEHNSEPTASVKNGVRRVGPKIDPPDLDRPTGYMVAKDEKADVQLQQATLSAFLDLTSDHKVGRKRGRAIVGAVMAEGPRKETAVKAMTVLGLDLDEGAMTGDELDRRVVASGWIGVRATTHSHGRRETAVPVKDLRRWCDDQGGEVESDATIRAYLGDRGKLAPTVVETARFLRRDHLTEGAVAIIGHDPVEKHRILIPLARPFVIDDPEAAKVEWRLYLAAVAEALGVVTDPATVDLARLFYLPRHVEGAHHSATVIGGRLLDLGDLDLTSARLAAAADQGAKGRRRARPGDGDSATLKRLRAWAARGGGDGLLICDLIRARSPERVRGENNGGLTIQCPNNHLHSNPGDPDDAGCWAVNAGDSTSGGFVIACQHAGCKAAGNDRLTHLGAMVDAGEVAWSDIEADEFLCVELEAGGGGVTLAEILPRIESIEPADLKAREALFAAVAGLEPFDQDQALQALKKATGTGLSTLRKAVAAHRPKRDGETPGDVVEVEGGHRVLTYSGEGVDQVEGRAFILETLRQANRAEPVFSLNLGSVMALDRASRRVEFRELSGPQFRAALAKRCSFARATEKGIGRRAIPDLDLSQAVFHGLEPGDLPEQPEVRRAPTIGRDGRLLDREGWHGGVYVALGGLTVPPIPDRPTWDDVDAALDLLDGDLLGDFPFFDQRDEAGRPDGRASRANALAMLITPYMRDLFTGPTPIFGIKKPQTGAGGTTLAQISALVLDGFETTSLTFTGDDAELQKALVTEARLSGSHILFDNIVGLESEVLKRALTAARIGGRLLGVNAKAECDNRFVWQFTGIGVDLQSEMGRRTAPINLDAGVRRGGGFKGRKGPDGRPVEFKPWVLESRGRLIAAILTLIRFWVVRGRPLGHRTLDSFEGWARAVGGVLEAVGGEAFLANQPRATSHDAD